ncbi:MAG: L-threonylcarbamoyladenylate synthase [Patescibacteria group bacterium]
MEIVRLTASHQASIIRRACRILRRGGTIVYPTDTLYGLGADPFSRRAYRKILKIKGRSARKGISVLIANQAQLKRVAATTVRDEKNLKSVWPGPVTVVLPKQKRVPLWLTGQRQTIAVRWPRQRFVSALLKSYGQPITATSANVSRQPASNSIREVLRQFGRRSDLPDLVIDAGRLPRRRPSGIIQFTSRGMRVFRPGTRVIKKRRHV